MKMISKNDILEALGVEQKEDRFLMGMLVGVGVGAVVGGIVAMLVAPKSGSELRESISTKGRDLMDKARGRMEREGGASSPSV